MVTVGGTSFEPPESDIIITPPGNIIYAPDLTDKLPGEGVQPIHNADPELTSLTPAVDYQITSPGEDGPAQPLSSAGKRPVGQPACSGQSCTITPDSSVQDFGIGALPVETPTAAPVQPAPDDSPCDFEQDFYNAAGSPGTNVDHTITIYNVGSDPDTYDLLAVSVWPVVFFNTFGTSITSVYVAASSSSDFIARVAVPGGASPGDFDAADITATSQADGSVTDTARVQTQVPIGIDWLDDFESGMGAWTTEIINPSSWAPTEWEIDDPNGWGPGTGYLSTNCAGTNIDDLYYSRYGDITLMSPYVELGTSPPQILSFHTWYSIRYGCDARDGGFVEINDGTGWEQIYPVGGYPDSGGMGGYDTDGFSGVSNGWEYYEFDISGYAGDVVQVRFHFASEYCGNWYHGWYVDDVAIFSPEYRCKLAPEFQADLGIAGSATEYLLTMTNTGANPDTYNLTYLNTFLPWTVDFFDASMMPITQVGPLVYGQSQNFYARVSVPGGASPGELDVAEIMATSQADPAVLDTAQVQTQVPYAIDWFDDFESGMGAWLAEVINPSTEAPTEWEIGNPNGAGPHTALSGTQCAGTNIDDYYYPSYADIVLISPFVQMGAGKQMLSFHTWYDTYIGNDCYPDGGFVEVNGGTGWSTITPVGGYPQDSVGPDDVDGFGGQSADWEYFEFDLSAYAGDIIQVRLRFVTESCRNNYWGWYVDDVYFGTPPAYRCELSPGTQANYGYPGTYPTHLLTLTNTGWGGDDTYSLAQSGPAIWPISNFYDTDWNLITEIFVPAGGSAAFYAEVQVAVGATPGELSSAMVQATSQGDGTVWDTAEIITYVPYQLDWSDGFESGAGAWFNDVISPSRPSTNWEIGSPAGPGPGAAYNGANCAGTNIDDYYYAMSGRELFTPDIALNTPFVELGAGRSVLSFYTWYNIRNGCSCTARDGGFVEIYDGTGWEQIYPEGGYPDNGIMGGYNTEGFSGDSAGWEFYQFDLADYAGELVQVRFHFAAESCFDSYSGWYVDDVSIRSADDYWCMLTPDHQSDWGPANSDIDYTLTLTNAGTENDTYDLALSSGWAAGLYDLAWNPISSIGPLVGGASQDFHLRVSIPDVDLTNHNLATVTATSQTDSGSRDVAEAATYLFQVPNRVAIFRSQRPYGSIRGTDDILNSWDIPYRTFSPASIGVVDLAPYDKAIIVAGGYQDASLFSAISANKAWFESFVTAGGVLNIHAWDDGEFFDIPMELEGTLSYGINPNVADPAHPFLNVPNVISTVGTWWYTYYKYFTSWPSWAAPVITETNTGMSQPLLLDYPWGNGRVIASGLACERGWEWYGSRLLENLILAMDGTAVPPAYAHFLSPDSVTALGVPGGSVDCTFTLSNLGATDDTYALSHVPIGPALWGVSGFYDESMNPITSIFLPSGASTGFTARVQIPAGAAQGDYDLSEIVVSSQGSGDSRASEIRTSVPHQADWLENFETGGSGWTTEVFQQGDPETNWEIGDPLGTGPGSAYSGSQCAGTNIDTYYYGSSSYELDMTLNSPWVELDAGPQVLTFYTWYSTHFSEWCGARDGGFVEINDGSGWTQIYPVDGYPVADGDFGGYWTDGFSGQSDGWEYYEFDLSAYSGDIVQIRFHFGTTSCRNLWGWYVDDVFIGSPPSYRFDLTPDLQISYGTPGGTVRYSLTITNTGGDDDSYALFSGSAWPVTFLDLALNPITAIGPVGFYGGTAKFYAQVGIPGGALPGIYDNADIYVISQGDPVFWQQSQVRTMVPFQTNWFDDFESGWGLWAAEVIRMSTNAPTEWEIGDPDGAGPGSAFSGTQCAGTNIDDYYYSYDADITLVSPFVELGAGLQILSFHTWYEMQPGCGSSWMYPDGGFVEINAGTGWTQIYPTGDYPAQNGEFGGYDTDGFSGHSDGWEYYEFDISAWAGDVVQVRFHFATASCQIYDGWYVDDVFMGSPPPYRFEVAPDFQLYYGQPNDMVRYRVAIANTGNNDDTYNLISNSVWSVNFLSLALAPITSIGPVGFYGGAIEFYAQVTIPIGAQPGSFDIAEISVISQGDPGIWETALVQTQVPHAIDWFDGFEGDWSEWTTEVLSQGYPSTLWEIGNPDWAGPGTPYSGDNCAGTNIDDYYFGQYNNQLDMTLNSPYIKIGIGTQILSFHTWYSLHAGCDNVDGGFVEINDGGGWVQIYPTGGYPDSGRIGGYNTDGFSGDSDGWEFYEFDLSAYSGDVVQIRFHFATTSCRWLSGWYIDELSIVALPTIISASPANGATGVNLASQVVVAFNKPMDPATVTYTCTPDPGGWSVNWNAGRTLAAFTHSNPFTENLDYTFEITGGNDELGVALVAGLIPNPWTFTAMGVHPTIVSTSPVAAETDVQLDADIVVDFSEPMIPGSVTYTCAPDPGGWSVSWNPDNMTATYSHTNPFQESTIYTFTVTGGTDIPGNALVAGAVPNPWSFRTLDVPPYIVSTYPSHGAAGLNAVPLDADIVVTFSEPMVPAVDIQCTQTRAAGPRYGTRKTRW
ncbi:MAG: immune inhibitor A [Thermoplasmata archaeon]